MFDKLEDSLDAKPETFPDWLTFRIEDDEPEGFYNAINSALGFYPEDRQAQLAFLNRCFDALDRIGAVPCKSAYWNHQLGWIEVIKYGRDRADIRRAVIAEWLANGAGPMEIWSGVFFGIPEHVTPLDQAIGYVPETD